MRSVTINSKNNTLIGNEIIDNSIKSNKGWFSRLVDGIRIEFHRIAAYRSLTRFSDRELADIGLARHEIRDAVWGENTK